MTRCVPPLTVFSLTSGIWLSLLSGCQEAPPPSVPSSSDSAIIRKQPDQTQHSDQDRNANPTAATLLTERSLPDGRSDAPVIQEEDARKDQGPFRFSWPRPSISDRQLALGALRKYATPHFDLITDIADDQAAELAPLVEAMLPFWSEYFGPLPPAPDGSDFHMTGYVMRDRDAFVRAELLPETLPLLFHGRQIGNQFWMNFQTFDYYRRHLLLHEATHVFMRHLPGCDESAPLWYLEGMAEILATHAVQADGRVTFNVMPQNRSQFSGHERIEMVRREVAADRALSVAEITAFKARDFERAEPYGWCWALCRFLDSHPRYQARFRSAARQLSRRPVAECLSEAFREVHDRLEIDWFAFIGDLDIGCDLERSTLTIPEPRADAVSAAIDIHSDRGWQPAGMKVEAGRRYSVTASGRFTLADQPRPWISEADGISFRYRDGHPLGQLQACVLNDSGTPAERGRSLLTVHPLGNSRELESSWTGPLYLRLNDAPGERADNRGTVHVVVQAQ